MKKPTKTKTRKKPAVRKAEKKEILTPKHLIAALDAIERWCGVVRDALKGIDAETRLVSNISPLVKVPPPLGNSCGRLESLRIPRKKSVKRKRK